LYVVSHGKLQVVARTRTVIPGIGTIAHINPPILANSAGNALAGGGILNDRGQVFFQATVANQTTGVLLVATPRGP
jgi:hypothetical protein